MSDISIPIEDKKDESEMNAHTADRNQSSIRQLNDKSIMNDSTEALQNRQDQFEFKVNSTHPNTQNSLIKNNVIGSADQSTHATPTILSPVTNSGNDLITKLEKKIS